MNGYQKKMIIKCPEEKKKRKQKKKKKRKKERKKQNKGEKKINSRGIVETTFLDNKRYVDTLGINTNN